MTQQLWRRLPSPWRPGLRTGFSAPGPRAGQDPKPAGWGQHSGSGDSAGPPRKGQPGEAPASPHSGKSLRPSHSRPSLPPHESPGGRRRRRRYLVIWKSNSFLLSAPSPAAHKEATVRGRGRGGGRLESEPPRETLNLGGRRPTPDPDHARPAPQHPPRPGSRSQAAPGLPACEPSPPRGRGKQPRPRGGRAAADSRPHGPRPRGKHTH